MTLMQSLKRLLMPSEDKERARLRKAASNNIAATNEILRTATEHLRKSKPNGGTGDVPCPPRQNLR